MQLLYGRNVYTEISLEQKANSCHIYMVEQNKMLLMLLNLALAVHLIEREHTSLSKPYKGDKYTSAFPATSTLVEIMKILCPL